MGEDLGNGHGVSQKREEGEGCLAGGADQGKNLVDPGEQSCPLGGWGGGGDGVSLSRGIGIGFGQDGDPRATYDLPPSLTEEEKQATIENLLMACSGVYHEAAAEIQSMKDGRPQRGSHPPGTFWYYNNWDSNVLGTIFIQLTGEDIFEALYNRFAVPLQMQEFQPSNGWYYYQEMSEHPAYHFSMSARDMARFGLLFLRDGRWRDEQIVPSEWVERSTQI